VSWDGSSTTEYTAKGRNLLNWDGELFALAGAGDTTGNWKLQGGQFVSFTYDRNEALSSPFVWDGLLYFATSGWNYPFALRTIDKSGHISMVYLGVAGGKPDSDGSLIIVKVPTGQIVVERISYKTIGGSSGNSIEIKIVGMDENGQYDEPFEEGHRVVVKDSPTGFSREYGIRNGELIDTDGGDNSAIRGNVDTHADLLALDTSDIMLGIKVGDGYIVEHDENNDDKSAIYTWDGADWNFTHLWEISLELKYGTYNVSAASFTFNKFAAKNDTGEEFDVLEVSFSGNCNVNIAAASGKSGDTRIMIFNVAVGQTVNLSFGFANKLIDGAELALTAGTHVVSLIRASTPIINIAPYGN
jgi:hypothetical protein